MKFSYYEEVIKFMSSVWKSRNRELPQIFPRLLLKVISLDYVDSYTKNFVDYEIIRYLSAKVPWPYPKNGVEDFLKNIVLPQLGNGYWMWGLFLKSKPGELIGAINLWRKCCPESWPSVYWTWNLGTFQKRVDPKKIDSL